MTSTPERPLSRWPDAIPLPLRVFATLLDVDATTGISAACHG